RRSRAFRDSFGPRTRSSASILRCTHGASWRGVAVSLFNSVLQVKVLRLDLSNCCHVLLLSIFSELHLLLGVPSCFRILQEQTRHINLALFNIPRHTLASFHRLNHSVRSRPVEGSSNCGPLAHDSICRRIRSVCLKSSSL